MPAALVHRDARPGPFLASRRLLWDVKITFGDSRYQGRSGCGSGSRARWLVVRWAYGRTTLHTRGCLTGGLAWIGVTACVIQCQGPWFFLTVGCEPRPGFVARGDARGHGPRKGKWTLCSSRRRGGVCSFPSGGRSAAVYSLQSRLPLEVIKK